MHWQALDLTQPVPHKLPPGNLAKIYDAIQADLKAMTPAARRAYFKKTKVAAILAMIGVNQDVMADWDGEGDFQLTGVSDETLESYNAWVNSPDFQQKGEFEKFMMEGIDDDEPLLSDLLQAEMPSLFEEDASTPGEKRMDKTVPFATLLAEASDFQLCDATFEKIADHYGGWKTDVSKYTPEERVVMLVWRSGARIENGGFEYLFSETFEGDPDFSQTAEACRTAGFNDGYALFQQAFNLFPDARVPTIAEERVDLYKAQDRTARRSLNDKFREIGVILSTHLESHLAAYIRKNAAAFKNLK